MFAVRRDPGPILGILGVDRLAHIDWQRPHSIAVPEGDVEVVLAESTFLRRTEDQVVLNPERNRSGTELGGAWPRRSPEPGSDDVTDEFRMSC